MIYFIVEFVISKVRTEGSGLLNCSDHDRQSSKLSEVFEQVINKTVKGLAPADDGVIWSAYCEPILLK